MENQTNPEAVTPDPHAWPLPDATVRDQAYAHAVDPGLGAAAEHDAGAATGREPGPKPDVFTTADGIFHARLSSGELVLRTKVPYKTFKRLTAMSEGDSLADLEMFVDEVGVGDARRIMEDCDDTIQLIVVAAKYFEKFNEIAQARLGESGLSLSS